MLNWEREVIVRGLENRKEISRYFVALNNFGRRVIRAASHVSLWYHVAAVRRLRLTRNGSGYICSIRNQCARD